MSLHHMLRAAAGRNNSPTPPASTDPQFNYVSLLLHGDGTNGAQNNTFLDSSSNAFSITRNGNTTQGSLSPYGNLWSNFFDGTGDYLTIPANTAFDFAAGNFTVEGWFYPTSLGSLNEMFCINYVPSTDGFATVRVTAGSNGAMYFLCSDNGATWINTTTTAANALALNTWTHVAAVRNGSNFTLYVNGASALSYTSSATLNNANNVSYLGVQNNRGSFTSFFTGYMSNVRAVKGTAVYTSAFTPPTAPLTAISGTSLLTCQSNRIIDNSSNNFTITRNGDVRVTKEAPFLPTAAYSTSVIGGSGYFDGTGDYLSLTTNSAFDFGTGNFTIEFWYNSSVNSAGYGAFVARSPQRYVVCMGASGNTPEMWINDYSLSGPICGSSTNICNGAWNHIAVVRNGNVFTMYVNGVAGATSNTWTGSISSSTAPMWFGTDPDFASRTITGYISNLRIVKGTAVYTAAFTPPTAPLTAITNTSLLLNFTNAGIFDNAAENDLETVGNAQISTSVKKYGTGSLAFDGTGDWLLVLDNTNLQLGSGAFTVEGWVYLSATGSVRGLVGKGTSTTGWLLSTNASNQVVFTDGTTATTTTTALAASTWYHIAVVRSGTGTNQTVIYIDGVSSATGTSSSNFNQTNGMYVGADRTAGNALNGYIDDLRITKGFARYTANFTPPTAAFPDQ